MSEMRERIAKAMYDLFPNVEISGKTIDWDDLPEGGPTKSVARKNAVAAMWAMREPTAAMISEGSDEIENQTDEGYDSNSEGERQYYIYIKSDAARPIWQAMIDEALK